MWKSFAIKGAPIAMTMKSKLITNIAVPASPPITLRVFNPFVDNHKKAKKIAKEARATAVIDI